MSSDTRALSQELQTWLFHQYQLLNARGEVKDLVHVWQDYHCSARIRRKYPLPPGGTGDCCAPKLLQYAYLNGLKPVCMAEIRRSSCLKWPSGCWASKTGGTK